MFKGLTFLKLRLKAPVHDCGGGEEEEETREILIL
jgi:hypothetical protein